eukprot:scaffold86_cov338-Pavlova_lutheri.AAC.88
MEAGGRGETTRPGASGTSGTGEGGGRERTGDVRFEPAPGGGSIRGAGRRTNRKTGFVSVSVETDVGDLDRSDGCEGEGWPGETSASDNTVRNEDESESEQGRKRTRSDGTDHAREVDDGSELKRNPRDNGRQTWKRTWPTKCRRRDGPRRKEKNAGGRGSGQNQRRGRIPAPHHRDAQRNRAPGRRERSQPKRPVDRKQTAHHRKARRSRIPRPSRRHWKADEGAGNEILHHERARLNETGCERIPSRPNHERTERRRHKATEVRGWATGDVGPERKANVPILVIECAPIR